MQCSCFGDIDWSSELSKVPATHDEHVFPNVNIADMFWFPRRQCLGPSGGPDISDAVSLQIIAYMIKGTP